MWNRGKSKYWYNLKTGEVERGRISLWSQRMGPYDTPEEAAAALERAAERNQEWEDEDEEYR